METGRQRGENSAKKCGKGGFCFELGRNKVKQKRKCFSEECGDPGANLVLDVELKWSQQG